MIAWNHDFRLHSDLHTTKSNQLTDCVDVKDVLDLNVWKGLKSKVVFLICLMSLHFIIFVFVDEAANPFSS